MTPDQEKNRNEELTGAHKNYEKGLHSYAFFKVNDQELSKDLVQNTFTKTWDYLVKGGSVDAMRSFLYHILNNLIVDEYRKRKNRTSSLEVLVEKGFEPGTGDSKRLFNIIDGKAATLLIKHLPIMYQKVVRMRFLEDLSLKEISIATKQSKNAVAVQVHRGLEKLRVIYNTPPKNK